MADHVVGQIQLTDDWAGGRVATENVDDHKIANDCALRPKARPGPESLARQCEYGKAAAIMVKILEIARLRSAEDSPHAGVALELIPALLE